MEKKVKGYVIRARIRAIELTYEEKQRATEAIWMLLGNAGDGIWVKSVNIVEDYEEEVEEEIKNQAAVPDTDRLITVVELAEYLKVPDSWVYGKVAQDAIPYIRVGRYVRFNLEEIKEWLRK